MASKLPKFIRYFPLSFILFSLSVGPLPAQSTELTPGVWFIEYCAIYYEQCKSFAPTWEELVKLNEEGSPDATSVKLAQVNCMIHGNLCKDNGVKGYPQMDLYKDGEFVEQFRGSRELERLTEFLERHAPASPTPAPVSLPAQSTELTTDTFKSSIANGVWFIEYFSTSSRHCRAFAPTWEELVKLNEEGIPDATGVKLAQVNCMVHGKLCNDNGVKNYPQMNLYKDGEFVEQFRGSRELERLTKFLRQNTPKQSPRLSGEFLVFGEHSESFIERIARCLSDHIKFIEAYIFHQSTQMVLLALIGLAIFVARIRKRLKRDAAEKDYTLLDKDRLG